MGREHKNKKYLPFIIGSCMVVISMAILVLAGRSVIADTDPQDGYSAMAGAERRDIDRFDIARRGGDRYVYDPDTGRWVLLSEKEEAETESGETEKEKDPEELIQEYLASAKRAFAEQDLEEARKYADKVLEIEANNRQAQFLIVKIEELEKPEPDMIVRRMEEARTMAEEINGVEKAEKDEGTDLSDEEAEIYRQKRELVSAFLDRGEDSLKAGELDEARGYARDALEVLPGEEEAKGFLARIDAAEEEARLKAEEEARRLEEERRVQEEEMRIAAEEEARLKAEEEARRLEERLEEERRIQEEEMRIAAEEEARLKAEEEARRLEEKERADPARQKAERIAGYMEKAEESIRSSDMSSARMYAEKALEVDANNEPAISMLDSIQRAEEEYRMELARAQQEQKKDIVTRYLERAREDLQNDKFDRARLYATRALEVENGKAEAREMLAEIDQAEADYRQTHSIKEETPTRGLAREARRLTAEKERQAARRKKEISRIRDNLSRAREYLAAGEYGRARKSAYQAWKIVPYDTEVAILIADINKEDMLASSETEPSTEEEVISNPEMPPSIDPLQKHEESKSLFDMVNYAMPELFGRKTPDPGRVDTARVMTLDDCVKEALKNNQHMKLGDEQVKLAETILWETRRKLFPEVTLRAERSFGKIGDQIDPLGQGATRHYQGKKLKADIKQNIFDGFGTWYETRQKQTNLEIIKLERDKIRNEVVEETEKAYYMLDKALKAVEIQKMISSNTARLIDVMDKAYQQELVAKVDYLKVKAYDMQAQFQYVSAREDVNLAEMVLLQAMDMHPDDHVMIEPVERPAELVQIGLQNCYNLALANSPDFKIKQKTIEFYDFERKMQKAKGWPKVDFEGSFGKAMEKYQPMRYESDYGIDPKGPNHAARGLEPEWYAGIRASLPFWGSTFEYNYVREFWASSVSTFRGTESATSYFNLKILDDLAYYTGIQSAKVGFERAKHEYIKARKDLAVEIKETYFRYRKAMLQMRVAEAQAEYQRTFVNVLEERRKFGEMDMPKLAEEYIKLAEDEYGLVHGDAEYFMAIAALNKSIGVSDYFDPMGRERPGWESREIDEAYELSGRDLSRIEKYLSRGKKALDRQKFSEARKFAVKAIAVDSDNEQARIFLGTVDQAEGIYREEKGNN